MELDIGQYFKAILKWWWLIILSTVLGAGGSYYVSMQQPRIYQTTTTLLVGQVIQESNPSGSDFSTTQQLAESYAQIAIRQPILQATVEKLDLSMTWLALRDLVNVSPVPETQLLAITVQDTSPERAVAIADEIAYQLILQSPTSPENEARQERSQFVQKELDDMEAKIETARGRIAELEAEVSAAVSASQIQSLQDEITNLDNLIRGWQRNYTELLSFLEGEGSPNYLTVIEPAQLPTVAVSPNIAVNVVVAAAIGFILALMAALLLEYLDDTIKSIDNLSASLDVTALGSISRIKGKNYREQLVTAHTSFSPLTEAYRGLRTNIQFMGVDQPAKSILITSSNPREGKSLTVANLGVAMAQAFLKTILVDTDLRQPSLHKIFGLSNQKGITDLICTPELQVEDCLQDTGIENLYVITSGPLPPNPSEMLGSRRMVTLLQQLKERADVVIFDSPPVLAVTDAVAFSKQVDSVILVIQAKRTRRSMAHQAVKRLRQVGANLMGAVLNQASRGESHYYYAQNYGYHDSLLTDQPVSAKVRRWWQRLPALK